MNGDVETTLDGIKNTKEYGWYHLINVRDLTKLGEIFYGN